MTLPVRVLLVPAASESAARLRAALERESDFLKVDVAATAEEALARLDADVYDCVLADHPLPDATGPEFLAAVRDHHPVLPFVLATDEGSEAVASEAVRRGVTDYVPSPPGRRTARELARRVREAVERTQTTSIRTDRVSLDPSSRRESERRFREISELSPDAIFRIEADGTIRYVSPAVESLLGYAPDDLVDEQFQMLVDADSLETAVSGFQRVLDGDVVHDLPVVLRREDGVRIDTEVSASPVYRGDDVHIVQGFARDVTERRVRERRLHRQEALLENSPDAFYVTDAAGEITFQSHPSADVLGYERRDLEGESVLQYIHPDDRQDVLADFEYLLANPTEAVTTEYRYRNQDGDWRWMENRAVNLLEDPDVEGILAVNRDVTERHQRQRELEATNERLERFASVVSHDLRNPLAVAVGAIDLVAMDCDDPHLDRASDALDRMDAIIEDVLAVARHGEDHLDTAPVDLHETVHRSLRTLDLGDATVHFGENTTLWADERRLSQLLENLLRNAVEHGSPCSRTESGNAVEHGSTSNRPGADDAVEHEATTTDRDATGDSDARSAVEDTAASGDVTITVGALDDGFYVADDGPGIPEADRERVFDTGHTTSETGTGLGLAIVTDVASEHGWTVSVDESDAGGARFSIHGARTE
ncbi:PAS domain S-box protein [Halorubellus litoreus]|uniref:histidine kinase n=1 Tax=Halorubellus litoreus TaxID=755308 RepID=A0ABD5VHM3_9EURY